ncbi:MAG: NB-ARC domain-containing protein, partial [Cyanobacteria bacterium J06626_26]
MTDDEALIFIESILERDYLNQTQEAIFREAWHGKSYMEIAKSTGYDYGYVKDEGAKLWRRISDALERKITKANVRNVLKKYNKSTNAQNTKIVSSFVDSSNQSENKKHSWEEIIDIHHFCGRTQETKTLEQWIFQENCRLISLAGIGGIGKTALSAQLLRHRHHAFDYTIWRTLRNTPPLSELLPELILFLSEQQEPLSDNIHSQIGQLMQYLHQHRCLLVLDNLESILL